MQTINNKLKGFSMSDYKRKFGLILAALASISLLAATPVYARNGTDNTTTIAKPISTGETDPVDPPITSGQRVVPEETHSTTTDDKTETTTGDVNSLRQKSKDMLATERKSKPEHSADIRLKACQAREVNLDTKITNYSTQAKKHLDAYNATLTKLQAYQTDKKLTVPSYAALITEANAQKTSAKVAVDALAAVSVKIDCSSADPAASVATVKTAVKNARIALQSYRTSVKNVLVALMTAKENSSTNSSGDASTSPSTTNNPKGTN